MDNNTFCDDEVESASTQELLALAKRAPGRAVNEANRRLAAIEAESGVARDDLDSLDVAPLCWVQGIALFELGHNDRAIVALQRAVAGASRSTQARIEVSLAAAEAGGGESDVAVARLERIAASTDDAVVVALARSQLGLVLLHRGDLPRCHELLSQALPALEASATEQHAVARVWGNIGYCELLLGELDASRVSHGRAIDVARSTGQTLVLAGALQNLGYLQTLAGDFSQAIQLLEQARQTYAEMDNAARRNMVTLYDDLAETYRLAGLTSEALRYTRVALWLAREGGNVEKQNDAEYRRARCLIEAGQMRTGRIAAERARVGFQSTGRPLMADRSLLLAIQAHDSDLVPEPELAGRAIEAAAELDAAGWLAEAASLRNAMAELLMRHGELTTARDVLASAIEELSPTTVITQLEGHYRHVLQCTLTGEDPSAMLDDAFAVLSAHRSRLVDTELRLGVAGLGERFRSCEVRYAVHHEQPAKVLLAEERWRGLGAVSPDRQSPSQDPELADQFSELRALNRLAPDDRAHDFIEQVGRLEGQIRSRSHTHAARDTSATDVGALDLVDLADQLAGRVFVEWIEAGAELYRFVLHADRTCSAMTCGRIDEIQHLGANLRRDLGRLLRSSREPEAQQSVRNSLIETAQQLAGRLFGQQKRETWLAGDVVLAPPAGLIDLPWALLTGTNGHAITVTPSAAMWLRPPQPPARKRASLVIGPGLIHGATDQAAFATVFPTGRHAGGATATVDNLRELFLASSFFHLAAHGRFRDDNPRFSSLDMIDGQVTLGEVESVPQAPRVVVLAVCEAARSTAVGAGAHGAATTLLEIGVDCIVAPIMAVPDRELGGVLADFYHLLPGRTPNAALALMQKRTPFDNALQWGTAHALVCLGRDTTAIVGDPTATDPVQP